MFAHIEYLLQYSLRWPISGKYAHHLSHLFYKHFIAYLFTYNHVSTVVLFHQHTMVYHHSTHSRHPRLCIRSALLGAVSLQRRHPKNRQQQTLNVMNWTNSMITSTFHHTMSEDVRDNIPTIEYLNAA